MSFDDAVKKKGTHEMAKKQKEECVVKRYVQVVFRDTKLFDASCFTFVQREQIKQDN